MFRLTVGRSLTPISSSKSSSTESGWSPTVCRVCIVVSTPKWSQQAVSQFSHDQLWNKIFMWNGAHPNSTERKWPHLSSEVLLEMHNDVPVNVWRGMRLQHDETQSRYARRVHDHLDRVCENNSIRHSAPVTYPTSLYSWFISMERHEEQFVRLASVYLN